MCYIPWNRRMAANKLEAFAAYFQLLTQYLPRKNTEILSQDNLPWGWELNVGNPECEAGVVTT